MHEPFLTADEVDADPSVLRDPNARQKRRNRSGQAAGISKEHIPGPFAWRLIEMMNSPAYRVLSLAAHRILSRLEIELEQHGRKSDENGKLPCTYAHFTEYGVCRNQIGPAIRELVALGFVEITRNGIAGNAESRQPALFLLTYRPFGSHKYVGNGWRRIGDMEQAEAVAKAARERTGDTRARKFGRRGGLASQAKKQNPQLGNPTDVGWETQPTNSDFRSGNPTESGQILGWVSQPPLESPRGEPMPARGQTTQTPRRRPPADDGEVPTECPNHGLQPKERKDNGKRTLRLVER
jgi:hypothetical protein